jgi:hypothetical protein
MTENVARRAGGQAGKPASQLVFHSIRGQLCVTSLLAPSQLLARVRDELMSLPPGLAQGSVVNRLFSRVSTPRDSHWTPQIGRLSWHLEGVRVFVHSDSHYIVTPALSGPLYEAELVERLIAKPKQRHAGVETPAVYSPVVQVVLQSMEGNVIITLDAEKDDVRQVMRDVVSDPVSRTESNGVAGAMVAALWKRPDIFRSVSLDVGFAVNASNTLWLQHISGENYAFFEGTESEPTSWEIVGPGFFGPHMDKHLRTPSVDTAVPQ